MPRYPFAEHPGDGLSRPPHPGHRKVGVLPELPGDPLGAAQVTQLTEGRGDGLPDLPGAGFLRSLQGRREQRISLCRTDAKAVPGGRHRGPPRVACSPNYITWVRQIRFAWHRPGVRQLCRADTFPLVAGLIWLWGHIQMKTCWSASCMRAAPLLSTRLEGRAQPDRGHLSRFIVKMILVTYKSGAHPHRPGAAAG